MKKTAIFYILLGISLGLFILGLFSIPDIKSRIYPVFPPVYNTINVIIDTKNAQDTDFILKTDEGYFSLPPSKNVLNKKLDKNTKEIEILVSDNFRGKINGIIIFNETKAFYFKDFKEFKKEKEELCPNNICAKYTKYKIEKEKIKYNKNSDSINFHSIQNTVCILILSLFSGSIIFFIPWVLMFISIVYFLNNREEIKIPKIKALYFSPFMFLLAALIYSNGIFDYLPWTDEYRTIEYSSPKEPIGTLFSDPGNPPLFYLLFRIFISVFGISIISMKIFPFIISIFALFCLWFFIKKRIDIKTANLAVFLAAINVPFVYYATEARCYILQMLLVPLIAYFLFKILDKGEKKDFIIYGILAAIASNVHYYQILFLISNFIFAVIYLSMEKRKKDILYLFFSNLAGAAAFLPFFIKTAFNEALFDSSFNTWLPEVNLFQIKKCIFYIFGGFLSVLLSIAFFIKTVFEKENSKRKTLILYCFFVIALTIIQGIILSYTIRPMLIERYLVLLSPLFITFISSLMTKEYKRNWFFIFFIIWIFYIQANSFEKNNKAKALIELPLSISKQYAEKNNENVYTILKFLNNPEYLENKNDYLSEKVQYQYTNDIDVIHVIDEIISKDKKKNEKTVIFTYFILPENRTEKEEYTCYFNSASDMCLWKIN